MYVCQARLTIRGHDRRTSPRASSVSQTPHRPSMTSCRRLVGIPGPARVGASAARGSEHKSSDRRCVAHADERVWRSFDGEWCVVGCRLVRLEQERRIVEHPSGRVGRRGEPWDSPWAIPMAWCPSRQASHRAAFEPMSASTSSASGRARRSLRLRVPGVGAYTAPVAFPPWSCRSLTSSNAPSTALDSTGCDGAARLHATPRRAGQWCVVAVRTPW
jgi:hypothetical protein